jgi:hypothetical protein
MKAKIAVATVSGIAYFQIVNALKSRNIPFLSLTPDEFIPMEAKVVITTEHERPLINHEKVLIFGNEMQLEVLINQAVQIAQGKESYEKVVIGVDPGEVFGLAVLADGIVVETCNCFSIQEALGKIENIVKSFCETRASSILVKIGDGIKECEEKLLEALNGMLPPNVMLESVGEAGTNRHMNETKQRRGLRDIGSAIRIAGRNGQTFDRRKADEQDS